MRRLDRHECLGVYGTYRSNEVFFPLIGAVLEGTQPGVVYANDGDSITQVYIEHEFGFSQIIGDRSEGFELDLQNYLLINKSFSIPKVRLYGTYVPNFLNSSSCDTYLSYRERSVCGSDTRAISESYIASCNRTVEFNLDRKGAVEYFENSLGLATRFWGSCEEFYKYSYAVFVYDDTKLAGVCYAAAVSDSKAEIDVVVLPEFRGRGLAKLVTAKFITAILKDGVIPLWDCFTNNDGSMALRASMGFVPILSSYKFYTIPNT